VFGDQALENLWPSLSLTNRVNFKTRLKWDFSNGSRIGTMVLNLLCDLRKTIAIAHDRKNGNARKRGTESRRYNRRAETNGLGKKTVLDVIRSINGIRISIRKLRDCSGCILQSGLPLFRANCTIYAAINNDGENHLLVATLKHVRELLRASTTKRDGLR
jgi:hypothetical protein